MTARELPQEEWSRLAPTELAQVWPLLKPGSTRILVVEDETGTIVGCWALAQILHVEGLWIAPAHRSTGHVARHLLRTMQQWIREQDVSAVVTASMSPDVSNYLQRIGASELPGQAYIWPMKES
jgi:N-acetylglutamate synthase-like GNAT family acetyltransferase